MGKRFTLLFWLFFLLAVLALFVMRPRAEELLPSRSIEAQGANIASAVQPQFQWSFLDKIEEAKKLVLDANLVLKVGQKDIVYYESRITQNANGTVSVTKKRMADPEREIALVLVDLKSGDLKLIAVTEKGNELIMPAGYEIENITRPNGITNNSWNTQRRVVEPKNHAVILNVWPYWVTERVPRIVKDVRGRSRTVYDNKKVVENRIYIPFSSELVAQELVDSGKNRRKYTVQKARELLAERQVMSKTYPGKLIVDIELLKPEVFERLPLIEQADYAEFLLDSEASLKRVDVIIGANGAFAYAYTCSGASACGLLQFTRGTYNDMKKKYPKALLISDFAIGYKDQVNLMMAAMLLHDNNLAAMISKFGETKISQTIKKYGEGIIEERLAANYNGGTVRPHKALSASILKNLTDWLINPMRTETKQYINKLRYIRENYN